MASTRPASVVLQCRIYLCRSFFIEDCEIQRTELFQIPWIGYVIRQLHNYACGYTLYHCLTWCVTVRQEDTLTWVFVILTSVSMDITDWRDLTPYSLVCWIVKVVRLIIVYGSQCSVHFFSLCENIVFCAFFSNLGLLVLSSLCRRETGSTSI